MTSKEIVEKLLQAIGIDVKHSSINYFAYVVDSETDTLLSMYDLPEFEFLSCTFESYDNMLHDLLHRRCVFVASNDSVTDIYISNPYVGMTKEEALIYADLHS